MKRFLCSMLLAGACVTSGMAYGADLSAEPRHHHYVMYYNRIILPPERHVLEKRPRPDGSYLMNGHWFQATTPGRQWAAGERIRLVAGEWHGSCSDAVFYNVWRRDYRGFAC